MGSKAPEDLHASDRLCVLRSLVCDGDHSPKRMVESRTWGRKEANDNNEPCAQNRVRHEGMYVRGIHIRPPNANGMLADSPRLGLAPDQIVIAALNDSMQCDWVVNHVP